MKILSKLQLLQLSPTARKAYDDQKAAAELEAEQARVDAMSDAEVLELTNNGAFGPGLVGKPLAERAKHVMLTTGDGQFGPAIIDPDYAAKQAAKRAGGAKERALSQVPGGGVSSEPVDEGDGDEVGGAGDDADLDPWRATTLSGAKLLAQKAGVSYKPGIKKQPLIAKLKEAGVIPPPVPKDEDDDEDELEGQG